MKVIKEKLPKLIKDKKVDFVVVNGENAADDGVGITKKNTEDNEWILYPNNQL